MADKPLDRSTDGTIFIGAGVAFKGNANVPGSASIDGKFEGELNARSLVVGPSGYVCGRIRVETAEVRRTVVDHLIVESKLVVRSSGSISGKVSYSKISVEEGGALAGSVEAITPSNAETAPPDFITPARAERIFPA